MIVKIYPTDSVVLCSGSSESQELTFETIEKALVKKVPRKYKKSSPGAKLSRIVALRVNAFEKGAWATGAAIDRQTMLDGLLSELSAHPADVLCDLTAKATALLRRLASNGALSRRDVEKIMAVLAMSEAVGMPMTTGSEAAS